MADAEDSKSSVRKDMRVQVPPSAPQFPPTVRRFLARKTLAVKSRAQILRLTLAELWLFSRNRYQAAGSRLENDRPPLRHPLTSMRAFSRFADCPRPR